MIETTQFCVGLDNKPGMLAKLCGTLTKAKINIEALCVSDDDECCWVNLVTSDVQAAEHALGEAGYRFLSEQVLKVQIGNRPGDLECVASKLADAQVNINFVYGAGVPGSPSMLVLSVDDIERAVAALQGSQQCEALAT
jgi:hypothetical protein